MGELERELIRRKGVNGGEVFSPRDKINHPPDGEWGRDCPTPLFLQTHPIVCDYIVISTRAFVHLHK